MTASAFAERYGAMRGVRVLQLPTINGVIKLAVDVASESTLRDVRDEIEIFAPSLRVSDLSVVARRLVVSGFGEEN